MRYETTIAKCPEQFIELTRTLHVGSLNVDRILESVRFFGKPAGELCLCRITARPQDIKIDL